MVVVPVDQAQDQAPPNQQEPQDRNPPPHIPNPPPLPAHIPDPEQPPNQPPNPPPNLLPNPPPHAPMQPPNPPENPPNPMQPQALPVQMPQLSWSYFKAEFSGKPEEDMIAHLLRINDWMETHNFPEEAKVQRFCLTLTGETRLWYETSNAAHHETHNNPSLHENLFQDSIRNEMLTHYNRIFIGSFKEFLQTIWQKFCRH